MVKLLYFDLSYHHQFYQGKTALRFHPLLPPCQCGGQSNQASGALRAGDGCF